MRNFWRDPMKDMERRLAKLRDDAADWAIQSIETSDEERSDLFLKASHHLTGLADQVERLIADAPHLR
jgi:hypothetical protein